MLLSLAIFSASAEMGRPNTRSWDPIYFFSSSTSALSVRKQEGKCSKCSKWLQIAKEAKKPRYRRYRTDSLKGFVNNSSLLPLAPGTSFSQLHIVIQVFWQITDRNMKNLGLTLNMSSEINAPPSSGWLLRSPGQGFNSHGQNFRPRIFPKIFHKKLHIKILQ